MSRVLIEVVGDAEDLEVKAMVALTKVPEVMELSVREPWAGFVDAVTRVDVEPGQVLVVRVPEDSSPERQRGIEAIMRMVLPGVEVVVDPVGVEFTAVSGFASEEELVAGVEAEHAAEQPPGPPDVPDVPGHRPVA